MQLWQRASDKQIDFLAITDHDTISGVRELSRTLSQNPAATVDHYGTKLVPGVEITAQDVKTVVHVLGLWLDIDHEPLIGFLDLQQKARDDRGLEISRRLESAGLPPTYEGALTYAKGAPLGRPHFARYLVELGLVENVSRAFNRWLGRGKIGDVDIAWPAVESVVEQIHEAGGLAVLAHPGKYLQGYGKCYELCQRFKEAGGDGIEVVSGAQQPKETRDLSRIAQRLGLAASTGSDFHSPEQTWCDLGSQQSLPELSEPIWDLQRS